MSLFAVRSSTSRCPNHSSSLGDCFGMLSAQVNRSCGEQHEIDSRACDMLPLRRARTSMKSHSLPLESCSFGRNRQRLGRQSVQRTAILAIIGLIGLGVATEGAFAARQSAIPKYIIAAVADKGRPAADIEADHNRKPAETLAFSGVKPGDWVLELVPGNGFYTRLLSAAVGPHGEVSIYTLFSLPKPGTPPPPVVAIAADPHYGNVKVTLQPLIEVRPTNSFDLVWTTQNYHDFHNVPDLVTKLNKAVFEALKPGGIYFILDHAAEAGSGSRDTNTLHRIDEETVKQEVKAAGFEVIGESSVLRNKNDPRSGKVFEPPIQGHTDQFLLKFRKPLK